MSWAIWITGLPGSGKSALARAAAAELAARGRRARVLELDEVRKTITPRPSYTDAERDVVYRALVYMAALMTEAGIPVIIDATAHRRAWRDLARAEIPRFAEVQLVCPPEVCRERERARRSSHAPRGIYARAGRPGATVPGVDVPYEPALAPELVIDTVREDIAAGATRITELAQHRWPGLSLDRGETSPGWAIWITGRPGSGKTTLAKRLAESLATRGIRVKVLDFHAARRFLLPADHASEGQEEVAHRALAYAAKLLTEAGIAVIVDATAPRRAWREAARALIPCFAEVQLLCPADICLERERAARWRLAGAPPHAGPLRPAPDISVEYEESLRAELVLRTNIHDPWSAVEQLLFLIRRLPQGSAIKLEPR
ncbi:MAG TPA: adenylyl-sulfate kinase [Methylomirabilota bacterium]|nr:adenylyl-sulfate kinase [Methylomirabilota bacterium]